MRIVILGILLSFSTTFAADVPAGAVSLFIVEKNENPENIMVVYSKLDANCEFQADPKRVSQPVFDFYWLMNGTTFKPVHPTIKSEIRKRLEFDSSTGNPNEFFVKLNDLKEMKHDLADPRAHVFSLATARGCKAGTNMHLGAAKQFAEIRLKSFYAESKKTLFPPFRKVISVTLNGNSLKTGEALSQTFYAK